MKTEQVEYEEGGTTFEGYAAWNEGARRPAVLVAHDWSGLNEPSRLAARQLAQLGYVGVALDNYGQGVRGDIAADNTHLMMPLLADRAMLRRRLLAGVEAAKRHPGVDPTRIAAIGYCFGGLCVLDLARAATPDVRAVASFHGIFAPPNLGPQARITAKVLLLHGWDDPLAPPDAVVAIARELTEAGADWQLHAYGHALHAFTFEGADVPERGIRYDANAARRSWDALRYFLDETFAATP